MKKTFRLLAAAAFTGVLALSSCTEQNDTPTPTDMNLHIKVTDITATSAHVEVEPTNDIWNYYFDVIRGEFLEVLTKETAQQFLDDEIDKRVENSGLSREDAFATMASKGADSHDFSNLNPNTEYAALAFGVDEELKINTRVFIKEFTTEFVPLSDNEFTITIDNRYNDGVDYTVTPTVEEDSYQVDIWPKSLVDELGDMGTINYYMDYNSFMLEWNAATGEFIYDNESICQPGRDYYVIAFGYADGEATTKLFKKEFRTIGGDPAKCTFTFEVSEIQSDRAVAKVVPSDKQVVYIWDVIDVATFEKYSKEKGSEQAAHEYILNGLIEQEMGEDTKRQFAVESLGRWSGYTSSDEEGADTETIFDLSPATEYIVWAVPVDATGKPEANFMSTKFKTVQ